ncbi:MAG: 50S ribosomal protein L10, partial [Patescibacteria group bacterium]
MSNLKKNNQIDELVRHLENTSNFALIKYEKTLHTTLEGLRRDLKKNDSELKVIKNTLFEKALRRIATKRKELNGVTKSAFPLKDNTALLTFGDDWSKGLSTFHTFTTKEKSVAFKVGFLESKVYEANQLKQIAQLPPKDQLVAKLIGTMKAPMAHLTNAMKFNMQKFV